MEREQAEKEQAELEQALPRTDSWLTVDGIPVSAFAELGRSLQNAQASAQDAQASARERRGREVRLTPAETTAIVSSGTQASAPPPPPPAAPKRSLHVMLIGILVLLLVGTNVHHVRENRAWEAENSTLMGRIKVLEKTAARADASDVRVSSSSSRSCDCGATPTSCPGSQLIDNCWFKVGWGECAAGALEDPVKPLEDALRVAWDSTTEAFSAVADTVASDMRQVCDAVHALGTYIFEL